MFSQGNFGHAFKKEWAWPRSPASSGWKRHPWGISCNHPPQIIGRLAIYLSRRSNPPVVGWQAIWTVVLARGGHFSGPGHPRTPVDYWRGNTGNEAIDKQIPMPLIWPGNIKRRMPDEPVCFWKKWLKFQNGRRNYKQIKKSILKLNERWIKKTAKSEETEMEHMERECTQAQ